MSIKVEVLRKYIRELIKQELEEASVTGNIDGGAGPPKTPAAFRKKNSKKIKKAGHEEGHKKPDVFGFTKVTEGKYHDYKKDESNAGEISTRVFKELLAETPGHQAEFGPSGDDYVITLSSGSTNGTYTITGID